MFDRIAPVYDVMNHVMTMGLDRRWRRLTVEAVVQPGARVLDACCGTGDLGDRRRARGRHRRPGSTSRARCSFAPGGKSDTIEWVQGDVLALPFTDDGSFDAATVGFGVRNVADLRRGSARAAPRPAPRRPARDPRDHAAAGASEAVLLALVRPGRAAARPGAARAARPTPTCPASVRRFPGAEELAAPDRRDAGSTELASASSAARSSPCTRRRPDERDARGGAGRPGPRRATWPRSRSSSTGRWPATRASSPRSARRR